MEQVTRINGNGQPYTLDLPKLVYITRHINDVALAHITENTGLVFKLNASGWAYECQPTESKQIAALFLTYNFRTRYFNNWNSKNELHLKGDHHIGFEVDSICYNCCKENRIVTNGLKSADRLAC